MSAPLLGTTCAPASPGAASAPSALCLRRTFIDVDESHQAPAPRARSAPPGAALRRADAFDDVFAEEREYIAGIADTLGRLWSATDTSERVGAAVVSAGFFGVAARDVASCPLLLATDDGVASKMKREASEAPTALSTHSGGEGGHRSESSAASGPPLVNDGSVGHPFICSRPCLYFASGACANGGACTFCHLPHPKRAAHLDKRHRDILRALPPARAKALILPLLWQKVREMDASSAGERVFADFAHACGTDDYSAPTRMSRPERALVGTLRPLGLKTALTMFQRTVEGAGDARITAAAEALVNQLRRAGVAQSELVLA